MRGVAVLVALLAGGCADPYRGESRSGSVPGELPSKPVARAPEPTAPARSPDEAARKAAGLAANWTGETAAANYRELARLMTGDARRQTEEAAARLPTDPQLEGTTSEGSVASVSTNDAGGLIVVTHETITTGDMRDTRYRVTLARATRTRAGWLLSRWEPQP